MGQSYIFFSHFCDKFAIGRVQDREGISGHSFYPFTGHPSPSAEEV